MQIDLFTFIAQIINFSILIFLLNKFLFKRIIKAMDERQAKISKDISEAEAKNADAEELVKQNRAVNEKLSRDSAGMLEEAKAAADKAKETFLALSRAEAEAVKQSWYRDIEAQKQVFMDGLKERSGEFMFLLAEKALKDLAGEELSQRISGVFLKKILDIESAKAQDIKAKIRDSKIPLKIRSSFEVKEPVKNEINIAIKEKFSYAGQIDFEISRDVCGVELVLDGYLIAWSVQEYLKQLDEELKKVWA